MEVISNISRLFFFLVLALWLTMGTVAADTGGKNNCMICHGERAITSKSGYFYIDPAKYAVTTHAQVGCVSCHDELSKRHPAEGVRPSRAICKECHAPVFEEYGHSLHSDMADCIGCHNPHAVKPLLSVSARDINTQCAKCHENSRIIKSHSKWLPQAALHIDTLPCITCHTDSPDYVITMYVVKRKTNSIFNDFTIASYEDLMRILPPDKKIGTMIDLNGDSFISLNELKKFNTDRRYRNLRLFGTMMPEVITHSYRIPDNRWDCTFCHASGPEAMQASYVAFPEKNGMYSRVAAEKGAILDILYGTPDFYMLGATRSAILSVIGAMIAAGGLMVPIVHGTFRFLTRKKREEQ